MQTHKNPTLRGSSTVPAKKSAPATPKAAPKYGSAAVKKEPVLNLDGKKWMVSILFVLQFLYFFTD